MTQYAFPVIDPNVTTGTQLAEYLNNWNTALLSQHAGAARPAYIEPGGLWIQEATPTLWHVMCHTGPTDAVIASFNPTTGSVAGSAFPAGTRMLFQQNAAPPGWTKDVSAAMNDAGLKVTTGTVANGGATVFSSVFGASKNTGGYTLLAADIPAHLHAVSITSGNNSVGHTHTGTTGNESAAHKHNENVSSAVGGGVFGVQGLVPDGSGESTSSANTGNNTTNHTHSFTTATNNVDHTHLVSGNTGNTGGGGSHLHTLSLDLKFTSVIVATKD